MENIKYLGCAALVCMILNGIEAQAQQGSKDRRAGWYSLGAMVHRATMDQIDRKQKFGLSQGAKMKLSSDGSKLYTMEEWGRLKIWDAKTAQLKGMVGLNYLSLDPDHFSLDFKRGIRKFRIFELETGQELGSLPYEKSRENRIIGFSANANQIWVYSGGQFDLYDYVEKRVVRQISIPKPNADKRWWLRGLSPQRTYLPMIDVDQNLHIVDLNKGMVTPVEGAKVKVGTFVTLFTDDESSLAVGDDGIRVYQAPLWKKSFEAEAATAQGKLGRPRYFSKKNNLLLVEHQSSVFRAYDANTGKLKYPEFKFKTQYPSGISRSGRWLVAYPEGDYNLVLYDLQTGKPQREICGRWCYATANSGPTFVQYEFSDREDVLFVMALDTVAAWSLHQPGKPQMFVDPEIKSQ